jgi:hypothetical protein
MINGGFTGGFDEMIDRIRKPLNLKKLFKHNVKGNGRKGSFGQSRLQKEYNIELEKINMSKNS